MNYARFKKAEGTGGGGDLASMALFQWNQHATLDGVAIGWKRAYRVVVWVKQSSDGADTGEASK